MFRLLAIFALVVPTNALVGTNCEKLTQDFEFSWRFMPMDIIEMEVYVKITSRQYAAIGISSNPNMVSMMDADAILIYDDYTSGKPTAVDYFMSSKAPCDERRANGVCPDTVYGHRNDINVTMARRSDDWVTVRFQRPRRNTDGRRDADWLPGRTSIMWAIGPHSGGIIQYHTTHTSVYAPNIIDLGRDINNVGCTMASAEPESEPSMDYPLPNCQAMDDNVYLSWELKGADVVLEIKASGMDFEREYLAFGLSGTPRRLQMVNMDGFYALRGNNGKLKVEDMFITQKMTCFNSNGACPDTMAQGSNDYKLLKSEIDGQSWTIRVKRALRTNDEKDTVWPTEGPHSVAWAKGPAQRETLQYHNKRQRSDVQVDFSKSTWVGCPGSQPKPEPETTGEGSNEGPNSRWNCERLLGDFDFEFAWIVDGDSITFDIYGPLQDNRYFGIGIVERTDRVEMEPADVILIKKFLGELSVKDYSITSHDKFECVQRGSEMRGVCEDVVAKGRDDFKAVALKEQDGYITVRLTRKLATEDWKDLPILASQRYQVIWAQGDVVNDVVGYHNFGTTLDRELTTWEPGRMPRINNCRAPRWAETEPVPEPEKPTAPMAMTGWNCQKLPDSDIEVAWMLYEDKIRFDIYATLEDRKYVSIALNEVTDKLEMEGSDTIMIEKVDGKIKVTDYVMPEGQKWSCVRGTGVCPDAEAGGVESLEVEKAEEKNGWIMVKVTRQLQTGDRKDINIRSSANYQIIWARGDVMRGYPQYHLGNKIRKLTTMIPNRPAVNRGCRDLSAEPEPEGSSTGERPAGSVEPTPEEKSLEKLAADPEGETDARLINLSYNCEKFTEGSAELRWAIVDDDIVFEVVGTLDTDNYLAVGIVKQELTHVEMEPADVIYITFSSGEVKVEDYFITAGGKYVCSNGLGVCEDSQANGVGVNSFKVLKKNYEDNKVMVKLTRKLVTGDSKDIDIIRGDQYQVTWARGDVRNGKPEYHSSRIRQLMLVRWDRTIINNGCDLPEPETKPEPTPEPEKDGEAWSCEKLPDTDIELGWYLEGDSVVFEIYATLERNTFLGVGLGEETSKIAMTPSDIIMLTLSESGELKVEDYTAGLSQKMPCTTAGLGVCPDNKAERWGHEDLEILKKEMKANWVTVRIKRKLNTGDRADIVIRPSAPYQVIWARGALAGPALSYHFRKRSQQLSVVTLARDAKINGCRAVDAEAEPTGDSSTSTGVLVAECKREIPYYGVMLGNLKNYHHGIQGTVYALSESSFFIKGFSYDGKGPDAFFWAGKEGSPSVNGVKIADELGSGDKLGKYENKDITITLRNNQKTSDFKWLSVWCVAQTVNFGDLILPADFSSPASVYIGDFSGPGEHGVGGTITVLNEKQYTVTKFTHDGLSPGAWFMGGKGDMPNTLGQKFPDENGSMQKLRAYNAEDVTITLPPGITMWDIDWISVYCPDVGVSFAHFKPPRSCIPGFVQSGLVNVKMTHCERLSDTFELSWGTVNGTHMGFQFEAALAEGEYAAIGLASNANAAIMEGADAMIASYDTRKSEPRLWDFTLTARSICNSTRTPASGVCADTLTGGSDNLKLLWSNKEDGLLKLQFVRPIASFDTAADVPLLTDRPWPVLWAIGPVSQDGKVQKHTSVGSSDVKINFGRSPSTSACRGVEPNVVQLPPWTDVPGVTSQVLLFTIGPTGGKRGYAGITGKSAWGWSFYVNGILAPEITVRRGTTYNFYIATGEEHPVYLTDESRGGYEQFTRDQKDQTRVFAGLDDGGLPSANAVGLLCEYKIRAGYERTLPEDYTTFRSWRRTLGLHCGASGGQDKVGRFTWTPDENTPDTLYYQCFKHKDFGWRFRVL